MGRDPSMISSGYSAGESTIVGISYIRSDDQKLFKYECRIDGTMILWHGVDIFDPGEGPGRWRDEGGCRADSKLSLTITWFN